MIEKSKRQETVLGVGWYRPAQWALLLSVSLDRDELESTHAEWLASAESSLETIRPTGHNPVKIDIDVEELIGAKKRTYLLTAMHEPISSQIKLDLWINTNKPIF